MGGKKKNQCLEMSIWEVQAKAFPVLHGAGTIQRPAGWWALVTIQHTQEGMDAVWSPAAQPQHKESSVSVLLVSESLVPGWEDIRKAFKPQTTYLREMAN